MATRTDLADFFFTNFPSAFTGDATYWYEARGGEDQDFVGAFSSILSSLSDADRKKAIDYLWTNFPDQFQGDKTYWYTDRGAENQSLVDAFSSAFTAAEIGPATVTDTGGDTGGDTGSDLDEIRLAEKKEAERLAAEDAARIEAERVAANLAAEKAAADAAAKAAADAEAAAAKKAADDAANAALEAERRAAEQAAADKAAADAEAARQAAAAEAARKAEEERLAAVAKIAEDNRLTEVMLETFPWLNDIPGIYNAIFEGLTDDLPDEIILANIRDTEGYKERFPAMDLRKTEGYNPINEYEYLQLEDSYKGLLASYGVSNLISNEPGLITEWIGGDVSPVELSTRIDEGYASMTDAAPQVQEAFRQFYGIDLDDATLLTYFLDRDLGINEMENVVAASQVGGAALKYGLNITRTRAELLQSEGVTYEMARAGYADIAREGPQLETLARLHSYNPLSQEDLESFVFHEDPDIVMRRRRIFDTALAEFSGAGAVSVTDRGALSELVDIDQSV